MRRTLASQQFYSAMKKTILLVLIFVTGFLQSHTQLLSANKTGFDLSAATIYVDDTDFSLVKKAAALLQKDIEAVCEKKIAITNNITAVKGNIIVVGSIEKSALVKQLQQEGKINTAAIKKKMGSISNSNHGK